MLANEWRWTAGPAGWCAALFTALVIGAAHGATDPNLPIPIENAAGHTGEFQVRLSERSPLSKPSDVARRVSLNDGTSEADYELAKEVFDVYVPKSPGADGKYGLVVLLPMPWHAKPPRDWPAVLETHHLIWIGDPAGGDGRPPLQRIGLMLDAAHGAQKAWPIDDARVYAFITEIRPIVSAVALDYPDVFQGSVCTPGWPWYNKVADPRTRMLWSTDKFARPEPQQLAMDKSRSRFFCVTREQANSAGDPEELIYKQGYLEAGFKHAKMAVVPWSEMSVFSTYSPRWFEEGVKFLDSSIAEAAPASVKQGPGSSDIEKGQSAPTPDDPAEKAAKALSLAKGYIAAERYDIARTKLNKIVQDYPGTPAAKEARSLLETIQNK